MTWRSPCRRPVTTEYTLKESTTVKVGAHCSVSTIRGQVLIVPGTDSVFSVMEALVVRDVSRLVIVDGEERVEGVVTVSDLIDYVVLRHVESTEGERHARTPLSPAPPASWTLP